jgi:hypothetical protein
LKQTNEADEFGGHMEIAMSLTNDDLKKIEKTLEPTFQGIEFRVQGIESKLQAHDRQFDSMHEKLDGLIRTTDEFLHIVRRHDDEFVVIRAQHEKMRNVLIKKGIASEDELSVTS